MTTQLIRRMRPLLGTFVEINVYASLDKPQTELAIRSAYAKIERIQNLMSAHDPASELSKLNHSNGEWVPLSLETSEVLSLGLYLQNKTQNRFNCFSNAFLADEGILPNLQPTKTAQILSENTTLVAEDLEIKGLKGRAKRPLLISLDGIAKGYAVDAAVEILQKHGIESGWINAGGDSRIFGDTSLECIQSSQKNLQPLSSLGQLTNCAIATSEVSDSENLSYPSKIIDHKGISPPTATVTIIAKKTWLADALTKVFLLTPPEEHKQLAQVFKVDYHYRLH
ncbi:FAD:protein FMN transferase [Thiomicrorhabdus heinhorstiae]|uniref:FAD:protein FMN transferase n=1 Tax=Thiomicrorhabdus heinhorstiae TaxID=2748010 RepID=A0ABS0BSC3_9GAMM|nr:FAD:protein FMN transferase [Thiomicrorhabdus heinhorstiae]MBF6056775.1 FAD:protein FMN transferase [Thiomicrorhabdus heinhorstiae]